MSTSLIQSYLPSIINFTKDQILNPLKPLDKRVLGIFAVIFGLACVGVSCFRLVKRNYFTRVENSESIEKAIIGKANKVFYDSNELKKIQDELDKKGLRLNATPPLAVDQEINQEGKKYYLDSINNPEAQKVAEMVIDKHLKYISMNQFLEALHHTVNQFNTWLTEHTEIKDYSIGTVQTKSQGWVGSLALRYLEKLPARKVDMGYAQFEIGSYFDHFRKHGNSPLVIFDDFSLSGTQVTEKIMREIHTWLVKLAKQENLHAHIVFVIPYMTQYAKTQITEYAKTIQEEVKAESDGQSSFGITLINSYTIPTISELPLEPKERALFKELIDISDDAARRQVLLWSAFKVVDFMSMPVFFRDAFVNYTLNRFARMEHAEVKKIAPWYYTRPNFIPGVVPPYKKVQ